jgi:hypothetical protein
VHKRWVLNLEEEFFQQGDEEKRNDLPVSALFDREKPGVTKSQVSALLEPSVSRSSAVIPNFATPADCSVERQTFSGTLSAA